MTEFDITGLGGSPATGLSFNTQGFGLFSGKNDCAFDGDIDIIVSAEKPGKRSRLRDRVYRHYRLLQHDWLDCRHAVQL